MVCVFGVCYCKVWVGQYVVEQWLVYGIVSCLIIIFIVGFVMVLQVLGIYQYVVWVSIKVVNIIRVIVWQYGNIGEVVYVYYDLGVFGFIELCVMISGY